MKRFYIGAALVFTLLAALVLWPSVSNGLAAAPQVAAADAQNMGKAVFVSLHYADQAAFLVKHIEAFRGAKGRTPEQVKALSALLSKIDVQTFAGVAAKPKRMALKAEVEKLKGLFTAAEWTAFARPDLAKLAGGMLQVRRSPMFCTCTADSSTWCASGCRYADSCAYWAWGCGTLLLDECNGLCNGQCP